MPLDILVIGDKALKPLDAVEILQMEPAGSDGCASVVGVSGFQDVEVMAAVANLVAISVIAVQHTVRHVLVVMDLLLVIPADEGVLVARRKVFAVRIFTRRMVERLVACRVVEVNLRSDHDRRVNAQLGAAVFAAKIIDLRHGLQGALHVVQRRGGLGIAKVLHGRAAAFAEAGRVRRVGKPLHGSGGANLLEEAEAAPLGKLGVLAKFDIRVSKGLHGGIVGSLGRSGFGVGGFGSSPRIGSRLACRLQARLGISEDLHIQVAHSNSLIKGSLRSRDLRIRVGHRLQPGSLDIFRDRKRLLGLCLSLDGSIGDTLGSNRCRRRRIRFALSDGDHLLASGDLCLRCLDLLRFPTGFNAGQIRIRSSKLRVGRCKLSLSGFDLLLGGRNGTGIGLRGLTGGLQRRLGILLGLLCARKLGFSLGLDILSSGKRSFGSFELLTATSGFIGLLRLRKRIGSLIGGQLFSSDAFLCSGESGGGIFLSCSCCRALALRRFGRVKRRLGSGERVFQSRHLGRVRLRLRAINGRFNLVHGNLSSLEFAASISGSLSSLLSRSLLDRQVLLGGQLVISLLLPLRSLTGLRERSVGSVSPRNLIRERSRSAYSRRSRAGGDQRGHPHPRPSTKHPLDRTIAVGKRVRVLTHVDLRESILTTAI